MFSFIKITALSAMIGLGAIASGCQSDSKSHKMAGHQMGVECAKCGVTWATSSTPMHGGKGDAVTVVKRTEKSMVCPDCQNAAGEYLQVGRGKVAGDIVHSCKACGGEMKVCHVE